MSDKATDKRPQFFMVEDAVIDNYNLDPYTGWLYIVIVKHADKRTGEAFPGIARLCKLANMSRAQVMRSIKNLEDNHLIEVRRDTKPLKGENRQRGVNHYFVLSASGNAYKQPQVVSDSDYPSSSQILGVVSGVDCNHNQLEPESMNQYKPTGTELVVIEGKAKEPKSKKKATQEPHYMANAKQHESMIIWLVKKLRPEINVDFVGLNGLYKDMLEEYTAACETISNAGLTVEDLPGEYAYLSAKGWPSFGIKKMAEYALDYAGHKTRQNGAVKTEQSGSTELYSDLMLGGAEVAS